MITEGTKKQKLKIGYCVKSIPVYVNFRKRTRESLAIELHQEGKTYHDVARTVGMSPNTMKAILSRAGLDQYSTESRPYEPSSEGLVDNSW